MPDYSKLQRTIKIPIEIRGIGLSGRKTSVRLFPALPDFGIAFYQKGKITQLTPKTVKIKEHTVGCGEIWTIEHLLSALYGLKIDNVLIESKTKEIPFGDGSSRLFSEALENNIFSTFNTALYSQIKEEIKINSSNSFIKIAPYPALLINLSMSNRRIESQKKSLIINEKTYVNDIASARTFALVKDSDPRLKKLPAYGIGVTGSGVFSREPLRFKDEFIRHKILDLIGDLAVLGSRIKGKIVGHNISHSLNHRLIKKILSLKNF